MSSSPLSDVPIKISSWGFKGSKTPPPPLANQQRWRLNRQRSSPADKCLPWKAVVQLSSCLTLHALHSRSDGSSSRRCPHFTSPSPPCHRSRPVGGLGVRSKHDASRPRESSGHRSTVSKSCCPHAQVPVVLRELETDSGLLSVLRPELEGRRN